MGLDQGVETGGQANVGKGRQGGHQQELQQPPDQLPSALASVAKGEGVVHQIVRACGGDHGHRKRLLKRQVEQAHQQCCGQQLHHHA